MTVTYTLKVSNAALCGFAKLLFRWKGSIYKLLYREMLIFILLYYGLSGLYRYVLNGEQRRAFEKITIYCQAFTDLIPLSFVLGFYVSIVVARWWQQYMSIPWPDRVATLVGCHVVGADERGRMMRRTLVRYLNLMTVVTCQGISTSVKRRFPTLDHIVEAGLMTTDEKQVYEDMPARHGRWWVPTQWFTALLVRARQEGRIRDDILFKQILDEMLAFRGCCGMLFSYDWISVPLVYTQVVTIAIHTFFLATLMGRQYLDPDLGYKGHEVDLYVPVFTILQFFFYMGWLKVAEQLINPFGEDDDDFELNWIIDRNMQVSLLIVDEMFMKHPDLVRDNFWDELEPQLPYTKHSIHLKTEPHLGSTVDLNVSATDATFVPMIPIAEEKAVPSTPRWRRNSGTTTVTTRNPTPLAVHRDPRSALNEYSMAASLSKQPSMISLRSVRTALNDFRNAFNGSSDNDIAVHRAKLDVDCSLVNSWMNSNDAKPSMSVTTDDLLSENPHSSAAGTDQSQDGPGQYQAMFTVTSNVFGSGTGVAPACCPSAPWSGDGAEHLVTAPSAVIDMSGPLMTPDNVWATATPTTATAMSNGGTDLLSSGIMWNCVHDSDAAVAAVGVGGLADESSRLMNMEAAFVTDIEPETTTGTAAVASGRSDQLPLPPLAGPSAANYPLVSVIEVDECDSSQSTVSSVAELLQS